MKRLADYQRSKVYAWERKFFECVIAFDLQKTTNTALSLEECDAFLKMIFLKKRKPKIKDGRGARRASFCSNGKKRGGFINLPKWARVRWVIVHEAAHAFMAHDRFAAHHGADFMRAYIDLIEKHFGIPKAFTEASAKASGLKIAD